MKIDAPPMVSVSSSVALTQGVQGSSPRVRKEERPTVGSVLRYTRRTKALHNDEVDADDAGSPYIVFRGERAG